MKIRLSEAIKSAWASKPYRILQRFIPNSSVNGVPTKLGRAVELAIALVGVVLFIGGASVMMYNGFAYYVVSRTGGEAAQLGVIWDRVLMASAYFWGGTVLVAGFLTFSR